MSEANTTSGPRVRVARHRAKSAARGSRRVEVTIPARDTQFVKAIADALRSGGQDAERIRAMFKPIVSARRARTGAELVAFFRESPLVEAELTIERDQSTGRAIDLEQ